MTLAICNALQVVVYRAARHYILIASHRTFWFVGVNEYPPTTQNQQNTRFVLIAMP